MDKPYEKPKIVKQTKMNFPIDIINTHSGGTGKQVCKQCSSCHSCR
jgi:hypothetical protein